MTQKNTLDKSPWQRLVLLFRDRFFESDADAPGSGFTPNLYQIMGFLATPGLFISVLALPPLADLARARTGPMLSVLVHGFHLFFAAYSFAVVMFATVFEWDTLFPDRRDFLILGSFPLRVRDIFTAKFASLGWFLMILMLAVSGPLAGMAVFLAVVLHDRGVMIVAGAQIVCTLDASAFGFFVVAAFQGLLISTLSPRTFRRVSPWIQVLGMSLAVVSLLLFPVYSQLLVPMAAAHPRWLFCFPPFWFAGTYDLMALHGSAVFAQLGMFGLKALAAAITATVVLWVIGFRRHYRHTLESEDTSSRKPGRAIFNKWISTPEELAIFRFTGRMLARSGKHKLFLATYCSAGLSIGALFIIGVDGAHAVVSDRGLRSIPFLIQFVVLSGFRAGFQYPVDLHANWVFQMTESHWSQIARRVGRLRVLFTGLVPIVILFIPMSAAYWGLHAALFDAVFQLIAGALWIEFLFWTFETVPFTCSYFQGRTNLVLLVAAYIYGIGFYCLRMSDIEVALEHHPVRATIYLCAGAALVALSWRRKPAAAAVLFDASEPVVQTLDLT